MKKHSKVLLLSILLVLLVFSIRAYAHAGRTDGDGGHTDRDTGEYHYHHGYPAHDHYDMDGDGDVDCPYEFDDQTGVNSGSNTGNNHSKSDNSYDTNRSEIDVYHSSASEPTTPKSNSADSEREETFRLSIGDMFESLFLIIFLTLFFIGPSAFALYGLAVVLLQIPCSWIWKLIKPSMSEDDRKKRATFTANAILCVVLYILFLTPVVEWLIGSPNTLAVIIILIGILVFAGVYTCISYSNDNDSLYRTISTLKKQQSELELQLETATSKSQKSDRRATYFESQCTKKSDEVEQLKKENMELFAVINDLRSGVAIASSDADGDSFISLLISEGIYFVNGRTPVKGKVTDRKPFGDFTAYVSQRGRCYHSDPYCGSGYLSAVHIFTVCNRKAPCSKCKDVLPDGLPEWYTSNPDYFSLK